MLIAGVLDNLREWLWKPGSGHRYSNKMFVAVGLSQLNVSTWKNFYGCRVWSLVYMLPGIGTVPVTILSEFMSTGNAEWHDMAWGVDFTEVLPVLF